MRYTSFSIYNFKGIQNLQLNLDETPASKVFTLVGLNESGKTTIMEALSFFHENIRDINEHNLTLHPSGIIDKHSLIPKNRKDNFTDSTKIKAVFELDEKDIKDLERNLKSNDFNNAEVNLTMSIEFEFIFEHSSYKEVKVLWENSIQGKEGKKKNSQDLTELHKAWNPAYNFIRKNIPPIIYYPNFLFDFPDVIYLEKSEGEGREQEFYRKLLQDILDSLENNLNLEQHIIERIRSGKRQDREALNSVLNKMGAKITKLVFSENLSVFTTDTSKKSITVSYPEIDEKNNFSVELQLKDGEDSYYIRERSLGFRWFFTFLLLTQFRVHRDAGIPNLVFLFDEPASNLHQTAQQRLIKALEELIKSDVSVIYSTHSHHLINSKWLENTFIVKNKALEYEEEDIDSFEPTNVEVKKYRTFVSQHPNQHTYYQPILDVLEYRPSNLEAIRDVIMVEGKNDFYTLSYFQNIIFRSERTIPILPGTSASNLTTVIQLYYAWGKKFIVLLDGDNEGKKQKKRYYDTFGSIVTDRIFTLGDVDSSWEGYTTERLLESVDALNIQKSVYSNEEKFSKKFLNLALQENLVNSSSVNLSKTTKDRFKKLLDFLSNALEK